MVNGIGASDPRGLNKRRCSKLRVVSRVRQETPEEDQRTYQLKRFKYNNKDKDNRLQTLIDKIVKFVSEIQTTKISNRIFDIYV